MSLTAYCHLFYNQSMHVSNSFQHRAKQINVFDSRGSAQQTK